MAYLNTTTTPNALLARISHALVAWAERRAQMNVYRRTFKELDMLSSRELADLGLHRSELHRVAKEAAGL